MITNHGNITTASTGLSMDPPTTVGGAEVTMRRTEDHEATMATGGCGMCICVGFVYACVQRPLYVGVVMGVVMSLCRPPYDAKCSLQEARSKKHGADSIKVSQWVGG